MRKKVSIHRERTRLKLISELVYSQPSGWFGHVVRPLRMSLMLPMKRPRTPSPVILWLCGGGWLEVDKDVWIPELLDYARAGYAVASVEYRMSSQAPFPAPLMDVKTAIRFLRAQAARFGLDKERFAVMGESAGGYLAAMAGTTGGVAVFDGPEWRDESGAVQAVVEWYGPVDFATVSICDSTDAYTRYSSPENLLLCASARENPDKAMAANPTAYVGADTPPFLILHGERDTMVPMAQSEALYEALTRNGTDVTLCEIEGAGHGTGEFVQPEFSSLVLEFLDSRLGK